MRRHWGMNNIHVILIPVYAEELGFDDYKGAFLMSIEAGADIIGRLLFGWIVDKKIVPLPLLFAFSMIVSAILITIYTFVASNYHAASVTIACVGFSMGIVHTGNFMLLADKVGLASLQNALGVMFLMLCVPFTFLLQMPGK